MYDCAAGQMPISGCVYIALSEYDYLWVRKPNKRICTPWTEWGVPVFFLTGPPNFTCIRNLPVKNCGRSVLHFIEADIRNEMFIRMIYMQITSNNYSVLIFRKLWRGSDILSSKLIIAIANVAVKSNVDILLLKNRFCKNKHLNEWFLKCWGLSGA